MIASKRKSFLFVAAFVIVYAAVNLLTRKTASLSLPNPYRVIES